MMWNIVELAKSIGATIGTAKRGLENSLVAYCLGLTDQNPAQGETMSAFPFNEKACQQKYGISVDAAHRTPLAIACQSKHGIAGYSAENVLTMGLRRAWLEIHQF